MSNHAHDQRGVATVFGLALLALLVLVTLGCAVAVSVLAGHRRAEAAADLAALAGAQARQGGNDPCRAAVQVADANGAVLDRCVVHGQDVTVDVHLAPAGLARLVGTTSTLHARARAGPAAGS